MNNDFIDKYDDKYAHIREHVVKSLFSKLNNNDVDVLTMFLVEIVNEIVNVFFTRDLARIAVVGIAPTF